MIQRKKTVIVIAVLVIGSLVTGAIATTATAESENVMISNVTISPDTPAPGETFRVTTIIENLEGGSGSVDITDVYVRDSTGLPEYERVENVGSIGEGQSMDVPLQLSLSDSKNLRVHVRGRTDGGELVKISYPLYVTVEEVDGIRVSLSTGDAVVDEDTPVNVTVANGESQAISSLELKLGSDSANVTEDRRVSASIATNSERVYGYQVTFDNPGNHTLEAMLSYQTESGYERTVRETVPVEVTAEEISDVQLSITSNEATVGGDTPVNVTVANGGSQAISNVELNLSSDSGTVTDARRVSALIPKQFERTYGYSITFDEPGDQLLQATVSYQTQEGYERAIRETLAVDVDILVDDAYLSASTETRDSENVLVATLTNFGNLPLEDVQVGVEAEDKEIDWSANPDIKPYSSSVVELDISDIAPDEGEVIASYTIGETRQTITRSVTFDSEPEAEIELTSIDVSRSGETLTLRGDASNIGESYANGVLVSVVADDDVTPVSPSKKYFVGGIDASEFGTFELTARTTSNVSSVPVRIEYTDDGDRVSQIVDLDIETGSTPEVGVDQTGEDSDNQGGRGPFSMLNEIPWGMIGLGLLGTIVVITGGVYMWRRNGQ